MLPILPVFRFPEAQGTQSVLQWMPRPVRLQSLFDIRPFTNLVGPVTLYTGRDDKRALVLVGNSSSQSESILQVLGNNSSSPVRAEVEWLCRLGARKMTIAHVADDLKMQFGSNGTDHFYLQLGNGPGSILGASVVNEGFGFQVLDNGNLLFGSSSTNYAGNIAFGVRPESTFPTVCINSLVWFYGAQFTSQRESNATSTAQLLWQHRHHTSGTPGAGFGGYILYQLDSSTTANQDAAKETITWATATHASRKSKWVRSLFDTAERTALTHETDGARATTYVPAGAGTGNARVGGFIFDHYANVGNVGTGEDDLYSDTIPASTLSVDGDKLKAEYAGTILGAAVPTRQIRLYFAGTLIWDSTALTLAANTDWALEAIVIRESSSVVRCSVRANTTTATAAPYTTYTRITGLTLTNTQILKVTGEAAGVGAATDDIVARIGTVSWFPAA